MDSIRKGERHCLDQLAQTLGGGPPGSRVHTVCRLLAPYVAEFIGAMMVTLTVALTSRSDAGYEATNALAPLAIGAMVAAMLYAYGHVSGAHFNPAVTVAIYVRGKISFLTTVVPYICVQVAGAVAGAQIAARVVGVQYLPTLELDPDVVSVGDAFLLEFLYTYALCTTVLNTATTAQLEGNQFYGVAIAFVVVAGAAAIGPITGAALNPAFATAFHSIQEAAREGSPDVWLYWVAGMSAGVVAGLLFHITNNEETDLRFLPPAVHVNTTLEHRAAAVGGHTKTYHETTNIPWMETTTDTVDVDRDIDMDDDEHDEHDYNNENHHNKHSGNSVGNNNNNNNNNSNNNNGVEEVAVHEEESEA